MIYFNENYLKITYKADLNCVVMNWNGFAKGENFRKGLNTGLELVQLKRATHWLADLRNMKIVTPEDQEWSNTNWFPRFLKSSARKMAIVVSTDVFNQIAVEKIMSKVPESALTVSYFNSIERAQEWFAVKEEAKQTVR